MRTPISLFGQRTYSWVSPELIREELFSPDRLRQHGESLAAAQPVFSTETGRASTLEPPSRQRSGPARVLSRHRPRGRDTEGRSRRRRSGFSTTTTSSRSRSSRSAATCRPATTANCPSWPPARLPACRACSASLGPMSPTPTAASTPTCSAASSKPTRASSR